MQSEEVPSFVASREDILTATNPANVVYLLSKMKWDGFKIGHPSTMTSKGPLKEVVTVFKDEKRGKISLNVVLRDVPFQFGIRPPPKEKNWKLSIDVPLRPEEKASVVGYEKRVQDWVKYFALDIVGPEKEDEAETLYKKVTSCIRKGGIKNKADRDYMNSSAPAKEKAEKSKTMERFADTLRPRIEFKYGPDKELTDIPDFVIERSTGNEKETELVPFEELQNPFVGDVFLSFPDSISMNAKNEFFIRPTITGILYKRPLKKNNRSKNVMHFEVVDDDMGSVALPADRSGVAPTISASVDPFQEFAPRSM